MRFTQLEYLFLLVFPFASAVVHEQQRPFFMSGGPSLIKETAATEEGLRLRSIYHRGSYTGPNPGLFRKCDIIQTQQQDTFLPVRLRKETTLRPALSKSALFDRYYRKSETFLQAQALRDQFGIAETLSFEAADEFVPDVAHRPTVLSLAMMANNAYADKAENSTDWYDIGTPWKKNASFGWESDGLRGYVFANTDNSLLVVSIKGTSAGLWGGGPTGEKDKLNDNTLFSCCCGRISRAWTPVCDCFHENEYQCNLQCLYDNISHNELYYTLAMEIYEAVQDEYKNATIWLTGHSLGGALASLVSQTLYVPTVTFEIPGDQLASRRLHLPYANVDHSRTPLWHFGHTADPIFVGACTGPSSSCWYGGFAMETRCHTGKVCTWDTVNEKNWSLDIRAHRVQDVIEKILKDEKEFPSLPDCVPEVKECVDCGLWEFVDPRDNKTTGPSVTPTATKSVPDPPEDPWMTL